MFGRLLTTQSNVHKFFLPLEKFGHISHWNGEKRSSRALPVLEIFKKNPGASDFDVDSSFDVWIVSLQLFS